MVDQVPQGQFAPTQPITVTLDAQTWQTVINQLMEGQYKVMAPIIGGIIAQFANPQPSQGSNVIVGEGPPPGYIPPQSQTQTINGADNGTTDSPPAAGDAA